MASKGVVRKGDLCSGHDCWPPRDATSWSPDVYANNLNVERYSDTLAEHCCIDDCHTGIYMGTRSVYANGLAIQVKDDPIDCGSICDECSSDVGINS